MEEVSIPLSLLEPILSTITSAFYFSQTFDLADSYRTNMGHQVKNSKMTSELETASQIINGFIEAARKEDEEEVDGQGSDS